MITVATAGGVVVAVTHAEASSLPQLPNTYRMQVTSLPTASSSTPQTGPQLVAF
jgi:hypothetical protein